MADIFAAMKKLIFLGACLVALTSQPVLAQTGGAGVVIMRVYEGSGQTRVVLAYGGNKTEVINFENGFSEEKVKASAANFQQVVSRLQQEGYSLKGLTSASSPGYPTTWVFVKGQ
jgi:hypothetical protein